MAFLAKFDAAFTKLFKKAPTVFHFAQTVIAFAAPIINQELDLNDPALMAVVDPIINEIKTGLATASAIAGDGTSATTLASTLSAVQQNLSQVLSLAQVKDPAVQAKFTSNVNLVIGELNAVIAMVNPPAQAVTPVVTP